MIGLVVRLGGRLPRFPAALCRRGAGGHRSLRPVLESLAPQATQAVIGKARGLAGWLFHIAWARCGVRRRSVGPTISRSSRAPR
jgi:hypothetical protein